MSGPVMMSLAIAITVCSLVLLIWRDPLRLRVAARGRTSGAVGWRTAQRRMLGAASLAPGFLLLIFGQTAPFLIWAGVLLVSGWILTALGAPKR